MDSTDLKAENVLYFLNQHANQMKFSVEWKQKLLALLCDSAAGFLNLDTLDNFIYLISIYLVSTNQYVEHLSCRKRKLLLGSGGKFAACLDKIQQDSFKIGPTEQLFVQHLKNNAGRLKLSHSLTRGLLCFDANQVKRIVVHLVKLSLWNKNF